MTIMTRIQQAAQELKQNKKPVSETFLMWAVLNELPDEEMYALGSDIIDIAEKVTLFLSKGSALEVNK